MSFGDVLILIGVVAAIVAVVAVWMGIRQGSTAKTSSSVVTDDLPKVNVYDLGMIPLSAHDIGVVHVWLQIRTSVRLLAVDQQRVIDALRKVCENDSLIVCGIVVGSSPGPNMRLTEYAVKSLEPILADFLRAQGVIGEKDVQYLTVRMRCRAYDDWRPAEQPAAAAASPA